MAEPSRRACAGLRPSAPTSLPPLAARLVAVTLADQAGAALDAAGRARI
ncbi:hypothetical protein ABZ826_35050 [Streptomyces sp. NPDC047515]